MLFIAEDSVAMEREDLATELPPKFARQRIVMALYSYGLYSYGLYSYGLSLPDSV